MYNSEEIESFCTKSCYLRPSSNLFMNVMQYLGNVMQYLFFHKIAQYKLGAPCSDSETFFGLHLYLAERHCKNLQRAKGPAKCKSGPSYYTVSKRNHLLYHFKKQQFTSTWPIFTRKNTFEKKNGLGNAHWTNHIEFELRGPGPPGRTCTSTTGYFYEKTKIS